jgi:hypothetical protein
LSIPIFADAANRCSKVLGSFLELRSQLQQRHPDVPLLGLVHEFQAPRRRSAPTLWDVGMAFPDPFVGDKTILLKRIRSPVP